MTSSLPVVVTYTDVLNGTGPMANTSEKETYLPPFDETGVIVSSVFIFTFLVIGLAGNALTLTVILYYKTLSTNVFLRFILSLCVSDLISALISWLFLYRRTWGFDYWPPLPDVFCKFYWAADYMTSYVTAMHILSFAVLRLVSIQFPFFYNKIKLLHAHIWIGIIWAIGFIAAFIPIWVIFGPGQPDRHNGDSQNSRWPACTVLVDKVEQYKAFQEISYPIFLYIPTGGVTIVCLFTVVLVKSRLSKKAGTKKQEKQHRKEKQAVLQLVLIMFAFLLGYLPFTAYEFWSIQDFPPTRYYFVADWWFGMIEYLLLRFSECLNPLFYNIGSTKVRKHTKMFLKTKILHQAVRNTSTTMISNIEQLSSHPRSGTSSGRGASRIEINAGD